jgi:hypothetical protein
LALILNPRAKKRRLKEGSSLDIEAASSSSPNTVQQPHAESGVSEKQKDGRTQTQTHDQHHGPLQNPVSKEEGETNYTIDPVGAAIRDIGTHDTANQRTG